MTQKPNRLRPCKLDLNEIYSLKSFSELKDFSFHLLGEEAMLSSHGKIGSMSDFNFKGSLQEFHEWILQYPVKFWEYCRILDMLPLKQNDLILDIGGGSSPISCYLSSKGCRIEIIDYEIVPGKFSIVKNSNKLAQRYGWKLKAIRGTATKLPYEDNCFDHIISVSVLEHVGDFNEQVQVFKEAERVLKRGGMFAITFDYGDVKTGYHHQCIRDSKAIKVLIDQTGFLVIGNDDFEDIDYDSLEVKEWEHRERERLKRQSNLKQRISRVYKSLRGYTSKHIWYTAFSLFLTK